MNKELDDKINLIKREVSFFSQPLVWIDHEFNFIPVEIDKHFLFFESYFYDSFHANIEKKYAIGKFEEFLYNQIGHRYFDIRTDGSKQIYKFDWSELAVYTFDGDYYDNSYFANYRNDPIAEDDSITDHIKEGFDEKTKAKVMEILNEVKFKFEWFREKINSEILGITISDKNSPKAESLTHPFTKIKNSKSDNKLKDLATTYSDTSMKALKLTFKQGFNISEISIPLSEYCENPLEEIENAMKGEVTINSKIKFKINQNQLSDFFYRMYLNKILLDNKTYITKWLCNYFEYRYTQKEESDYKSLNQASVYDIFKESKSVSKINRIMDFEWLPIKRKKKI